jgi:hypothetical protein
MIDTLYILILLLSGLLLIVQELVIRSKDKIIKAQLELLVRCEPILAAIVKAQEQIKES